MKGIKILATILMLTASTLIYGQGGVLTDPMFGAQVFVEPGQTEAETEQWFKTMHENGMSICRIRMFESYMHRPDGSWDFSLFDRAFRMAEKYNIRVMGTFFPLTEKTDIGGWKFPKDDAQLNSFAEYISQLTKHFKQFKSLYAWVLINEPGGGLKDNEFSRKMRRLWDEQHQQPEYLPNGYPVLVDLQTERFKRYMTSWMLNWIAGEVRKHDTAIQLHVNNHAIFDNLTEYDFPYWRTFLNSLGGSAHASWHFGLFSRPEYALAMSANSEIIKSGAGNLPWLMTELQGGNNTYSGAHAMCPTAGEITQWLWTVLGSEGKGAIFWSLNARASGIESGEWALLDFQHQPTDRVAAIAEVSKCVEQNKALISSAKCLDNKISLVYIRESIWTEDVVTQNTPAAKDGRRMGMRNLLGYFKTLSEIGVTPRIQAIEEYDFTRADYSGQTIVLAHQLAIPGIYVARLENFVAKGGRLLIDGLTGFYDANVHNVMLTGFPFQKLFGGAISEFKHIDQNIWLPLDGIEVPASCWYGIIKPDGQTQTICSRDQLSLATRARFSKGEVVWIPSLLGIAAWKTDAAPLAEWLRKELNLGQLPFVFSNYEKGMLMKTMNSGKAYLTIIINKSGGKRSVQIDGNHKGLQPVVFFKNGGGSINPGNVTIDAEETLVIHWK